jgi:AcrR family transcriptional regulator
MIDAAPERDLTMSDLAARLGVRSPSLYNHIGGLDDLRSALALLGVRELEGRLARAAIGKAGADALRAMGMAYRDFALERPGLYLTAQRAPDPNDADLNAASNAVIDVLRLVLEPMGLSMQEQIHTIRGLRSIVHGFVSLELMGGFGLPEDVDESFRRLLDTFVAGLQPS